MQLGRYTLQNLIGEGAYGQVWRSVLKGESGFSKSVAVKLLHEKLTQDEERIRSLTHEALIGAQIKHNNVVEVHEFTRIDGRLLLVMELIEGETLSAILAKNPKGLGVQQVSDILRQIASGLHHAHSLRDADGNPMGLIHRDLKPSNLMIDKDNTVKICDFGIAISTLAERQTTTGSVRGSIGYMSPEQIRGLPLTHATDIWSLAVIAYQLLTGQRLFQGKDPLNVSLQINSLIADAPAAELEHHSPILAHLIKACLQQRADKRPSAFQLMRGLDCKTLKELEDTLATFEQPTAILEADAANLAALQKNRTTASFAYVPAEQSKADNKQSSADSAPSGTTLHLPKSQSKSKLRKWSALIALGLGGVGLGLFFLRTENTPTETPKMEWVETRVTSSNWAQALGGLALSPDSNTVAYSLRGKQVDQGLYLKPVEAGAPTKIVDGGWLVFDWFADGKRLLVGTDVKENGAEHGFQIGIMDLQGEFESLKLNAQTAKVSPDQKKIAVAGRRNEGAYIFFLDGQAPILLQAGGSWGNNVSSLAWSPDGTHVAFIAKTMLQGKGSRAIMVVEIATRKSIQLLQDNRLQASTGHAMLDWIAPDTLLFLKNQNDPYYASSSWTSGPRNVQAELWALENASTQSNTDEAEVIYAWPGERIGTLTHAGSRIVLSKVLDLQDVWLLNLKQPSKPTQLTQDIMSDVPRFWLPDGRVVFNSDRFGKNHLMTIRPGQLSPEVLLEIPGPAQVAACGDQVLLVHPPWEAPRSSVASTTVISTIPMEGGTPQERIRLDLSPTLVHAACSAKAEKALFSRYDVNDLALSWIDLQDWTVGESALRLPHHTTWSLSPDGDYLAGTTIDEKPFLIDLKTGERKTLDLPLSHPQRFTWAPNGKSLYLTGMIGTNDASNYLVLEVKLNGKSRVLSTQDKQWMSWPTVSPDGNDLAMLVWSFPEDIWTLNQTQLSNTP